VASARHGAFLAVTRAILFHGGCVVLAHSKLVIAMIKRSIPICLFAFVLTGCAEEPPKVGLEVGNIAPSLEGTDTNGNRIKLADYKGKVVVVDFWATWCGPCVSMIPHEKSLYKRMEGRPLVFLAVSVDEKKGALTTFLESEKIEWANVFDGLGGPISTAWHVDKYPTMFVIDAKGIIRYKYEGTVQLELDHAVDKMLSEIETK
jgi:thiol-disulfide isomerase/thioredoxin